MVCLEDLGIKSADDFGKSELTPKQISPTGLAAIYLYTSNPEHDQDLIKEYIEKQKPKDICRFNYFVKHPFMLNSIEDKKVKNKKIF